jgi:hypothetical protein
MYFINEKLIYDGTFTILTLIILFIKMWKFSKKLLNCISTLGWIKSNASKSFLKVFILCMLIIL